ncbi:hypothetical protein [Chroococcidiopsis sp.]|uniref:hypothetical protein n=1 Tax=Chroococcidiopsis sp. TaxID=3088168 RepID=UPI003F3AFBFF
MKNNSNGGTDWKQQLQSLIQDSSSQRKFTEMTDLLNEIVCILPSDACGHFVSLITLTIELLRTAQKTAFRIATSRRK